VAQECRSDFRILDFWILDFRNDSFAFYMVESSVLVRCTGTGYIDHLDRIWPYVVTLSQLGEFVCSEFCRTGTVCIVLGIM